MQTINYQGQEVQATLVNYLSGTIPTSTVDMDGDEELFRDEKGLYYLRRTLGLLADYHEDNHEGNIEASGRTHVHRITVNAAILWATTRLNSETLDLRQDAAAALKVATSTMNTTRRFADGSMSVTLHFAPEPARLLRAACELDGRSPVEEIYAAVSSYVVCTLHSGGRDKEAEHEAIFDDNAPDESNQPDSLAVAVDFTGSAAAALRTVAAVRGMSVKQAITECLANDAACWLADSNIRETPVYAEIFGLEVEGD